MPRPTRVEGLDLIRGIAIALVMLRHGWAQDIGGAGIVGVVMFFALSGYLITGVLIEELERDGRLDLKRFYRDRAVRLLPALVALLAVFCLGVLLFGSPQEQGRLWLSVVMGLTYTADVPAVVTAASASLGHLWTLAVEEQFYLVWPFLLLVWHRRGNRGRRLLALLCAVYALLLLTSVAVERPRDAYVLPTSWAVVLLLGAAARLYQQQVARLLPRDRTSRGVAAGLALAVLGALALAPDLKNWWGTYLLLGPVIGLCTVVLIFHLRDWERVRTRWLRPLLWLGTVSYAAYLWNHVIVVWLGGPLMQLGVGESVLSVVLTLLAAQLSLVLVERPARRWRSPRPKGEVAASREEERLESVSGASGSP